MKKEDMQKLEEMTHADLNIEIQRLQYYIDSNVERGKTERANELMEQKTTAMGIMYHH